MSNTVSSAYGELKYEFRPTGHGGTGLNVWHLKVHPESRGRGVGTGLVKEALAIAKREHCEFVTVNMGGGRPAANMLQSAGLTVMSCQDDPNLPEQDRHVDAFMDIYPYDWEDFPEGVTEEEDENWVGFER